MASEGLVLAVLVATSAATFVVNFVLLVALTYGRRQPLTRTFAMTLTVSLVTADMLIAVTVMPFSIYHQTDGSWKLGDILCRLYSGGDIMLCNASIFHLTGLACDRYLAVCRPFLHRRLTVSTARVTCVLLWLLAAVTSLILVFQAWQETIPDATQTRDICVVSLTPVYLVASVVLSFFLPLCLIVGFHFAILSSLRSSAGIVTSEHDVTRLCDVKSSGALADAKSDRGHQEKRSCVRPRSDDVARNYVTRRNSVEEAKQEMVPKENLKEDLLAEGTVKIKEPCKIGDANKGIKSKIWTLSVRETQTENDSSAESQIRKQPRRAISELTLSDSTKSSRAKRRVGDRAIKTVLWLVSCFALCWSPFFIVSLVRGFSPSSVPNEVNSTVLWLGYVNSTLNPFLLYRFNGTIRGAVRRLLRLGKRQSYSQSA